MHIPKWLIATAALLAVVLIAALAFFIGRDTSRPPAAATAASPAPQEPPAASDPAPAPAPAVPDDLKPPPAETSAAMASRSAIPSSAPAPAPDPSATAEARARVAAYFNQMEAIQSGGSGDQQEFAAKVVNAAAGGDFSGIDDLVRQASDAERRAVALQPPGECAEYHRLAVALLQESRTMIVALRDGLKRNDTSALTAMSASAQSLKSRSENLAQAEKSLRARYGT
jgi:hypothetical protein